MWFAGAAIASAVLTWIVQRFFLAPGMLDRPNARSSHARPTPRGGGIAIVLTLLVGAFMLGAGGALEWPELMALTLGGGALAVVGYVDDRAGLGVMPRFAVHLLAAAIAVALLIGREGARAMFPLLPEFVVLGVLLAGAVWSINLFNFMDGIDGIAGAQAVFMAAASALLIETTGSPLAWSAVCAMTAGACAGFLVWNWPPAKIFMGDVGSGFLGFWLAALALALHVSGSLDIWVSIILGTIFLADSTATLLSRMASGQKWYDAHRLHAYQKLTRRLGSHARVTLGVCAINVGIVLPAAWWAQRAEELAPWIAGSLLTISGAVCITLGAGVTEARSNE
jgi:Fuc2NAc and GlcNAc transferase